MIHARTLACTTVRQNIKTYEADYEKSENDIKALQSVGQIIGEVTRQLDEERCECSERGPEVRVKIPQACAVRCRRGYEREAESEGPEVPSDPSHCIHLNPFIHTIYTIPQAY
jgi:ATP-dependent 26S proteasome regulatory subunit